MQHPALSQIEGYWDGLRRGRPVPLRAEVDPRGIDQALEYAFILERIAPGIARFRLAGQHLNTLMGMEVRGMPMTALFSPDARRRVTEALEHLFEEPARIRIQLVSPGTAGRPELTGTLVLLPLKSDLGDISRALGCLVSEGSTGRTPRRFDVERVDITSLLGDRGEYDVQRTERRTQHAPAGLSEPEPPRYTTAESAPAAEPDVPPAPDAGSAAGPGGARPDGSRPPHLRLVHSRD